MTHFKDINVLQSHGILLKIMQLCIFWQAKNPSNHYTIQITHFQPLNYFFIQNGYSIHKCIYWSLFHPNSQLTLTEGVHMPKAWVNSSQCDENLKSYTITKLFKQYTFSHSTIFCFTLTTQITKFYICRPLINVIIFTIFIQFQGS